MTKYARSILYQVYSKTLFKKSAKNVNNNLNIKIMIPALIGAAGVIGGAVLGSQARQQQTNEEYQKMMYQGNINKDLANHTMKNQKELWNYTNYPNQVKQMKLAGLNPALMYGTAGQGGQSSAGQTGPVGLSDSKGVAMQQQQMAMGLQLAQIASQIKVNESVAEKNTAEAEKTAGADTEAAKAQTKLNERLTALQDTIEKVMNSQEQLNAANYFKVQAEERQVWEEVRELVRNNEIGDATKEEAIAKAGIENWNRIVDGFETIARIKLTEEKIHNLKGMLAVAWANVAIGEKTVSNQADHIANELMMGIRDLDRKDRELLKDWIYEGVHAGKEISGEILNWLTRGIGKNITEITGRLEELFDEGGNLTGTKQIQQTVTRTKD